MIEKTTDEGLSHGEEKSIAAPGLTASSAPSPTAGKTAKSPGERVFNKLSEGEAFFANLRNDLFLLSPEELKIFQQMKEESKSKKDNLSAAQKRLIKIIKEKDENFIRALSNVVNSLLGLHGKND